MRADRLFSIVLLLQRQQRLTAADLAGLLGVTERTIYRDMDALSLAGVPVYTRPGPDGGCFLDEQYRTSLNWFTGTELQTLLATGNAAPLADLGMQQALDQALLKLLALLPDRYQQEAARMQQRLYFDPAGWYDAADHRPTSPTAVLTLLKEAVWQDRVIEALYTTWEGVQQWRTLEPYSLVYRSGRWYLVAGNPRTGARHIYRAARFAEVRVQARQFERDRTFNIAAYWQAASLRFVDQLPAYPVTLRVLPGGLAYFEQMLAGRYEVLEKQATAWILRVHYLVFEEARTSVLGLGVEVEVIEPLALHVAVLDQARALLTREARQHG